MKPPKYTSLDGRSQNPLKSVAKPKLQGITDFKPALPPNENPWQRNTASALGSEEVPRLLQPAIADFPALPGQDNEGSAGEIAEAPSYDAPLLVTEKQDSQDEGDTSVSPLTSSSEPSRRVLEEAAARASEILWTHPFGADIYVHAESCVFQVHRDIVTRQSGWFREHLPPPNEDGAPTEVFLPYAARAVQPCLMFMYTKKIEVCERDTSWPLNTIHLPRCVLGYCAAVVLRVQAMAAQLLGIVEATADDLAEYLGTYFIDREMDEKDSLLFSVHLVNAFSIIHSEPSHDLMRPMRLALARVLDAAFPCLLRQPVFTDMLKMPMWKKWSAAIAADQIEYRKLVGQSHPLKGSTLPSENELEALFDRLLGETDWGDISG